MEERKLKDYKIRSGELNRTWNRSLAFWHLADGRSGHIEYRRSCEICKGENELQFQWPSLQSCLAFGWPFSLPSWLPQHSFLNRTTAYQDVPCQLFSEDQWHFCKIPWMLTEPCCRGPQQWGPWDHLKLSCWAVCISDRDLIAFLTWWLLPKAAS